jgi:Family of unknown function (DUF6082)
MAGSEIRRARHHRVYWPARPWLVSDTFRRVSLAFALIGVTIVALALVLLSPLALREFNSVRGVSWSQLSNIGQTYGAASAFLTGLALIGVAGSIVFQIRAIQVSRQQANREQHAHLIEMALTDPIYQRAWGGLHDRYGSTDRYRQHGYINLIVSFWQNQYALGGFRENSMRDEFASFFHGEAGRDFWADTRDMRIKTAAGRDRRFCEIMDEEYQKAVTAGPPAIKAEESIAEPSVDRKIMLSDSLAKDGTTLLLGAIGGFVIQSVIRHWRDHR